MNGNFFVIRVKDGFSDMKKTFLPIFALLVSFAIGCSKESTYFDNEKISSFEHAKENITFEIPEKDDDYSEKLSSYPDYVVFDELPSTKDIPENISLEANGYTPTLFTYYGTFKGYDVFGWEDYNTGWFIRTTFSIDRFVFESNNLLTLYCVEHSDTQKDFFAYEEETQIHLIYNRDVVISFVELYRDGVFDLNDVAYIYFSREIYLCRDGQYSFEYEYLDDGKVKIKCPSVDVAHYDQEMAIYKNFFYENKIPTYDYSYRFPKDVDRYFYNHDIKYDEKTIYLGNINGYDMFTSSDLKNSIFRGIFINIGPSAFILRRYIADLDMFGVFGYKDGSIYYVDDLLENQTIGVDSLDIIACQIYTNLLDIHIKNNGDATQFEQKFFENWKADYLKIKLSGLTKNSFD